MEKETTEDNYINYVLNKLEYLQKFTKNLDKFDLEPHEVKEILGKRVHVALTLMAEKERARRDFERAKRDFKIWYSEKFSAMRKQLNPSNLPGSKYASKSDIDAEVISENKELYLKMSEDVEEQESRLQFLRGILEQWGSLQFDLANMVKAMGIELNMYGSLKKPETESYSAPRQRKRIDE